MAKWKIALLLAAGLRVFYSVIAALLSMLLHPSAALIRSNALTQDLPTRGNWHYLLLGVWERFDTLWYLHIAQHGYDIPMAVIFYPLYPAAIRGISVFLPPMAAALLVSTVAAFFVLLGLLRLAPELTETGRLRLLLLVVVWPTSFILFAGYSESLAIALVLWAVAYAREERWWPATICGLLAGLGRPSGVLVCIPLLLLGAGRRQLRALPVLLTPLGLLGYWGWLWWSGRPAVWHAYGSYQGTPFAFPWETLWQVLRIVAHGDAVMALKLILIVLAAVFSLRRTVRSEDRLFAIAVILQMFMYTGRPIIGAARYVLMVYPAFLGWAAYAQGEWNSRRFAFAATALGALNLAWMVAFFDWSLVL